MNKREYLYTEQDLRNAVNNSNSIRSVLEKLGLTAGGSQYPRLRAEMDRFGIDYTHFTGKVWNKGKKFEYTPKREYSDVLVSDSPISSTYHLKNRLLRDSLIPNTCAVCGIDSWNGAKINLQLHHINGNRKDNRLDNLQLLCPNCHSQTDSFCGKNRGGGYLE